MVDTDRNVKDEINVPIALSAFRDKCGYGLGYGVHPANRKIPVVVM